MHYDVTSAHTHTHTQRCRLNCHSKKKKTGHSSSSHLSHSPLNLFKTGVTIERASMCISHNWFLHMAYGMSIWIYTYKDKKRAF
jgi:hypothetical protein